MAVMKENHPTCSDCGETVPNESYLTNGICVTCEDAKVFLGNMNAAIEREHENKEDFDSESYAPYQPFDSETVEIQYFDPNEPTMTNLGDEGRYWLIGDEPDAYEDESRAIYNEALNDLY
jgi:hypothetical protein